MEKITVVIADDSEKMREIIKNTLLADTQMEVVGEAKDGLEACEVIRMKEPDVLLLDMVMPERTGMEVLEQLADTAVFPKRPHVIVVSAVSEEKTVEQALQKGAEYYVVKPFAPNVLRDCVKAAAQGQTVGEDSDRVIKPTW